MIAAFVAVVVLVVAAGYWQRMWAALDQFSGERQRERELRFLAQQKAIAQQWTRENRRG
jgi:Tfp pilus assembly protein PilO